MPDNFETIKKIITPAGLEVDSSHLKIGDKFVKTFFIFSYPRYLSSGWFDSLINLTNLFDAAIFVNPIDTGLALKNLRKKTAQVQSQISDQQEKGLVRDPMLETALQDIEALRDSLQQAQEKLFSTAVYIALYADTLDDLARLESQVISLMEAKLVYIKPALFQQLEGMLSILPLGQDKLAITQPMDSGPISSFFPFVSDNLTSDQGILYGINRHNNSLVIFDRFSMENANQVVFAKAGAGKSILGNEPVLVREKSKTQLVTIGALVEKLIRRRGATQVDDELEGVIDPGFEVFSFNKDLKGEWSKVSVAARKTAPDVFYRITTKSGRTVTTTGDHNMIVLKNGLVTAERSSDITVGDYLPLPRNVGGNDASPKSLNLLKVLKSSRKIYVKGGKTIIQTHYDFLKRRTIDSRFDRYLYQYRKGRVAPIAYFLKLLSQLNIDTNDERLDGLKITSKSDKRSHPVHFSLNKHFLKILGYFTAEGTLTERAVLISNTDGEVLTDIAGALDALGIGFYFANGGVVIAERVFVELITCLGGKGKSKSKKVFPFIFGLGKELIAAYLSAYFEGDGGTERSSISAVSKSSQLISEISYLLFYFGIIGRICAKKKSGPGFSRKRMYWQMSISGQDNIRKFAAEINFISQKKRTRTAELMKESENTNVDIIPGTKAIFEEIYNLFSFALQKMPEISELKRNARNPSPGRLLRVIEKIEERIAEFENAGDGLEALRNLPIMHLLVTAGKESRELNGKLWEALGDSWRLMKNGTIRPGSKNVLTAAEIVGGQAFSLTEIKQVIHQGFRFMDLPIKSFGRSLQSALTDRPGSSTDYELIYNSTGYVLDAYQKTVSVDLPRLRELLARLKTLARADLFWDPIAKIEKIKNRKEKYVYDLTVDNEVFLAGRGGMFVHNSYATKLEIIRSLMMGLDVIVIDPENEYQRLAESFAGSFFNISLSSHEHINPFDIPIVPEQETAADTLRSHIVNLAGLLKLMLGKVTPEEDAMLDRAITETYASREITPDEDFSKAKAPLLEDLETVLRNLEGGTGIAERLYKFTKGSFAGFVNQPTNVDIQNRLIVFSIRDLEDELRPIAMYVILNFIWNLIRSKLKKRIMIVDEAWWMMKYEASASFLFGLAKRCRKYYLGLSTITQDVEDFLRSPYGRPIITNSSIQLLLRQAPATIDIVAKAFDLTEAEKNYLLTAEVGNGLFFAGRRHIAIQVIASYFEDQIITTNPEQLLEERGAK